MNAEPITPEIEVERQKIEKRAKELGLDPFDTVFHMVDYKDMIQLMCYTGFPRRINHWSYGMHSIIYENQYRYGLMKVYELVINSDPAHAYLLKNNNLLEQKFVIGHVYAHVDFFKNNLWFKPTNRNMVSEMAWHAERADKMRKMYGDEEVEKFVDICMSLDTLIDPYSLFYNTEFESISDRVKETMKGREQPRLIKTGNPFLDRLVNNNEYRRKEMRRILKEEKARRKFPRKLQKDVVKFLIDNAKYMNHNLETWKVDMLEMFRDEFYYFAPQRLTKIMNEGWASYWHYKLMAEEGFAGNDGIFEFAKIHSGVVPLDRQQPGPINPYSLGLQLYRWIEHRWDTGKHGLDYDKCDSLEKKLNWDTRDMKGREKIFQVRKYYNDLLFLSEFMDQDFVDEHKLWTYGYDEFGRVIVKSKDVEPVRQALVNSIYNGGEPLVYVKDGNFNNKGELLLYHDFDFTGKMLDIEKTLKVMRNIRSIWGRDVSIETKLPIQDKDGDIAGYADARLMCTEKSYVFYIFDEDGDVVEEREVEW
ncbi:SpoVR family protein [Candidatus Woesearchaeota archaeon]|nr:MAG: SpoVR family protein [Candidatus Woesearchaeota archaeon]